MKKAEFKKVVILLCLLFAAVLLNACQTTAVDTQIPVKAGDVPIQTSPVDVANDYIMVQAITPQATTIDQGNLFDNGGFEAGLEGWTGCAAGAIAESSDAYEGNKALKVNSGNCFYRSAEVSAGQDLVLSCYVRLESGTAWTGMGLGFADASWTTIGEGPTTIISGNSYARYDVSATAPANSKYASMWIYSDNPAVVDNCSLMLEDEPPPPPPPSGDNLLDNGDFEILDANNKPVNWVKGCGGAWKSISTNGTKGIQVSGGACVDQSLSAEDIAALKGKDYTLSCNLKQTGGYTAVSIFLDGQPKRWARATENTNLDFEVIEVKGTAGDISSGFVSIYSSKNATDSDNTKLDYCKLTVDEVIPPPSGDNLLENGDFESLNANNKPNNWIKGCGGSWTSVAGRSGQGLNLQNGVCVDQSLNSADLLQLSGKDFTYSCYAKNTGGYASMTIFLNGQAESVVIPASNSYQLVNLSGTAGQLSSGFVSIYSEAGLTVDDCSLEVEGSNPPGPVGTPSIDIRNNIEGTDYFALNLPMTFDIAVRNNGDVPFTNVTVTSDELDCSATYTNLAVGETKNLSCVNTVAPPSTFPSVSSFSHIVTATATTADGLVVTDSDQSGYRSMPRATGNLSASMVTDNRVVAAGSDVTFFVTVGHTGNVGSATEITSNVPDCARQLSPALSPRDFISYECTATNVQEGFNAFISAVNNGPYSGVGAANAEIVIEDTVGIAVISVGDIVSVGTDQNPEPYTFQVNIRNDGAVKFDSIEITSDVVAACNGTILELDPAETKSFTCTAPVLEPGQRITETFTVVASTSDGRQATDSDSTVIYRQSDIELDVSLGAEGDDIVTVNAGESLDVVITLRNVGYVDFNNIQALYIWRPNPYDGTVCQDAIPFSGIGDPDVAFDLAVGETKTFTCTLSNITEDVELNLVAYLSNTNLPGNAASGGNVFSRDPDDLIIKVN